MPTRGKPPEKGTITYRKEDLPPWLIDSFKSACSGDGKRIGQKLAALMEEEVRRTFGPGAETIFEIAKERQERKERKKEGHPDPTDNV